jgi:hypothetical protein
MIEGALFDDMQRFLSGDGTDQAIAAQSFVLLCEGNPARGRPPAYAAAARTVARVDGDGAPPPDVAVFDWGGDAFGVPALCVWYLEQATAAPRGIGAFPADDLPQAEVARRVRALLGAPGCYLTWEAP